MSRALTATAALLTCGSVIGSEAAQPSNIFIASSSAHATALKPITVNIAVGLRAYTDATVVAWDSTAMNGDVGLRTDVTVAAWDPTAMNGDVGLRTDATVAAWDPTAMNGDVGLHAFVTELGLVDNYQQSNVAIRLASATDRGVGFDHLRLGR